MPGVDFEGLLKEAMGLDAASLGPTAISRAVQQRMAECKLADVHAYWLRLRNSPSELQELIEAVVVPETWFFRDPEAFVAVASMARSELQQHPARGELRLLSLPCSSGEEPYSMAIALLDAGNAATRFRIDAIDISARVLELGRRARYGSNSFRGQDLAFRARHFQPVDGKWDLSEPVRQRVVFQHGNLFAADFLPGQAIYDFIFCRNVLIYFDQPAQTRALQVLLRLLRPGGCLFVAPSETALLPRDRLTSAQLPMAFAFHHTPEIAPPVARAAPAKVAPARTAKVIGKATTARAPRKREPAGNEVAATRAAGAPAVAATAPAGAPAIAPGGPDATFAQMQTLANQGRVVEAARACERSLRDDGPSARVYCLLGLLRDAAGDRAGAAALYRKALYLEPQHLDALTHLLLLLDRQGNRAAAGILRERLQRLEAKAAP